jgi:hypothetical protein
LLSLDIVPHPFEEENLGLAQVRGGGFIDKHCDSFVGLESRWNPGVLTALCPGGDEIGQPAMEPDAIGRITSRQVQKGKPCAN